MGGGGGALFAKTTQSKTAIKKEDKKLRAAKVQARRNLWYRR
jgi:hypothetical protein